MSTGPQVGDPGYRGPMKSVRMQERYLTALGALKREVTREMDRAQIGDEPGTTLSVAWDAVVAARVEVRAALLEEAEPSACRGVSGDESAGQDT